MKKFKKFAALGLSVIMTASLLAGCSGDKETEDTKATEDTAAVTDATEDTAEDTDEVTTTTGKVYFLNFKPETAEIMEEVMATFTEETGIQATVLTAAANQYEQTLTSEMGKTDAPTLFQINGPVGYENWKDYTLDLSGTDFYALLGDKSLAVTDGDGVYGIPYAIEGYGIIANKRIIADYCALDGAVIASIDEIDNFETLKAVAEDMQAKKDELGIEGAFASTSFSAGEDWRWQTHLANMPLYYEFKDLGVTDADTIEGTYLDNYKAIFDLYINNSIIEPGLVSSKTVNDSMTEFGMEEVAFTQNGDWGWGDISAANPDLSEDDVQFLPIYIGVDGEEDQGLCVGTENYWSINSQASEEDQQATLEFINWLLTSETGKNYVINELGFTTPFTSFGEDETPTNPLAKSIMAYAASGKTSVTWAFASMPSQTYKNNLGSALLEYAQGTGEWDAVETAFVDGWATEKANPTPDEAE